MPNNGWKCKECKDINQPGDAKCNCGAKKPSFFSSPIFYIAIGSGIFLMLLIVIVVNMLGVPEKKYKEALEKAYNDKTLSEDEKISLAKVQKVWNISDPQAEKWQKDVQKKLNLITLRPPSDSPPAEAKLNMQQGMNYARGKDWNNAIKEFTLAIQKHPTYDVAYSNRAVAYMQQKKFNKAMDDLKEAVRINPKNAIAHYNFVALYSLQNQLDRALDSLDRCLELGFNNYDALRADPDLNNVRKHPEFRKILEKHKVFIAN